MSVRVTVHVKPWLDALDAHIGPGSETVLALGAVLAAQFEQTQQYVHVVTGSLKASGRSKQRTNEDSWTGEIRYGGSAPGYPHPVVRYAEEEFTRGASHDAMRDIDLYSDLYERALGASVRARLK